MILWRYSRTSISNAKEKKKFFHHRVLVCKGRKSRDICSNRQVWPWRTKWSKEKANRILPTENIGHSKHSLLTTHEMSLHMDITICSILKSDCLYFLQLKMENLYTGIKKKKKTDLDLTVASIIISLLSNSGSKKAMKTTRPFR